MSQKFSLIGQINNILCNFRNFDCNTKIRLVIAYCVYSAELWNLPNDFIDGIYVAWR